MGSKTLLEDFIAQLNANVFMSEFAFAGTELHVPNLGQVELADHIVLLDDIGIVFQLKERDAGASIDTPDLMAWFANKVRKKAVKQLRSTRELLARFHGATLRNQRGHEVTVAPKHIAALHGVVVYRVPANVGFTPQHCYQSKSAGFVHFIRDVDYLGVCQYLVTPVEIADYLSFREKVLTSTSPDPRVSEAALVGQYIADDLGAAPSNKYEGVLRALREDFSAWDMSFFMEQFGDKIAYREGDVSETSHYRILSEFAKLSRSELREFKQRFALALEAVLADRFELPYRLACPRTGCGFLILPVTSDFASNSRSGLRNLSLASKHDLAVKKHVSLSIVRQPPHVDIEWMYTEGLNDPNPALTAALERDYPFRRTSERMMPRYLLDTETLGQVLGDTAV